MLFRRQRLLDVSLVFQVLSIKKGNDNSDLVSHRRRQQQTAATKLSHQSHLLLFNIVLFWLGRLWKKTRSSDPGGQIIMTVSCLAVAKFH